jgi:antitoxin YefM
MQVLTYKKFKNNLLKTLNKVSDDNEIIMVSVSTDKTVVLMSHDEYNSIQETFHLNSSKVNRNRLEDSIAEMKRQWN